MSTGVFCGNHEHFVTRTSLTKALLFLNWLRIVSFILPPMSKLKPTTVVCMHKKVLWHRTKRGTFSTQTELNLPVSLALTDGGK